MAQTKTIQLLRSSALYTPTTAGEGVSAKTALENAKAALIALSGRKDGEIVLARYQETGGEIKSLLGIYHTSPDLGNGQGTDGADVSYTDGWTFLQDITSSSDGLAALQAELDATQAGAGLNTDGSYIQTQNANALEIIGVSGSAATSLMSAIEKIAAHIGGLDKTASAENGKVVTTVTQVNGLVSETKEDVKSLQLGGYSKDTSATGAIASTDTVNTALSKLENTIAANAVHSNDQSITVTAEANNGGTNIEVAIDATTIVKDSTSHYLKGNYTLHQLNSSELAALSDDNVKEAYRLQTIGGSAAIGDVVKIYKDSSLNEVYLGASTDTIDAQTGVITKNTVTDPQSMNFAYHLADGTYSLVKIDVSKFLTQSEFADGLQVTGGVVSVKVDSASGKVRTGATPTGVTPGSADDSGLVDVLTVSSSGVKVDNIQAAINYATTNLAVSAEGDNYITAAVDANNNKKINVTADVQSLTAYAGTPGVYDSTTGAQTTAPVAGTLSGVADSLADGSDIATKVKTYVDGAIAIEAARSDAKNKADIVALDGTADATSVTSGNVPTADFQVLTKVVETDGVVQAVGAANGSTSATLKKLAATGAAEDVSIVDSNSLITATNVEGALQEIATNVNNNHIVNNDVITVATDTTNHNTKLTVTTGNGLEKTGTDGNTLAVKQGDGVTVDANGVSVKAGDGLVIDNSGNVNVNTGDGLEIASDAVKIKLDTATTTANITSDMLSISANGLMMKDTWDCGLF